MGKQKPFRNPFPVAQLVFMLMIFKNCHPLPSIMASGSNFSHTQSLACLYAGAHRVQKLTVTGLAQVMGARDLRTSGPTSLPVSQPSAAMSLFPGSQIQASWMGGESLMSHVQRMQQPKPSAAAPPQPPPRYAPSPARPEREPVAAGKSGLVAQPAVADPDQAWPYSRAANEARLAPAGILAAMAEARGVLAGARNAAGAVAAAPAPQLPPLDANNVESAAAGPRAVADARADAAQVQADGAGERFRAPGQPALPRVVEEPAREAVEIPDAAAASGQGAQEGLVQPEGRVQPEGFMAGVGSGELPSQPNFLQRSGGSAVVGSAMGVQVATAPPRLLETPGLISPCGSFWGRLKFIPLSWPGIVACYIASLKVINMCL